MDVGYPLFNKDANYHSHGMEKYRAYFDHCSECEPEIILEATPDYLYQKTAPTAIAAFRPRPRVLFILRKPSSRVYSFIKFSQHNEARLDNRVPISEVIEVLLNRPETLKDAQVSQVVEQSKYVNYLNPWVDLFGKENIRVFLFEHLKTSPRSFIKEIASYIGLDPQFYDYYDFPKKNETYEVKSRQLHRLKLKYASLIPKIFRKDRFKKIYYAFNTQRATPMSKDDQRILKRLDAEFASYNESLSRLLNVDLSVWK